jgi:sporulation protein YlmC with PRC-barrel domain
MRMAMKRMRMKSVVAATAVTVALCASPVAFAQQSGMPGSQPSPLAVNPTSGAQPQWYTQHGNEMRASKLIGTTVVNDANESIGKINEVVLSKDGKVAAVVIGVGGFLGMGEREVAVNFESLRIAHDSDNKTTVSLNATKDSLKSAPEWQWIGDRSGTTGNSSAPTQQPVSK